MKIEKSAEIIDIYDIGEYGSNYKKWVLLQLESGPRGGRGARKNLAEFIGSQISHVANVLNDDAHFSAEQAERAAVFFGLTQSELEFFLLLVQWNRASTEALQDVYRRQLDRRVAKVQEARRNLKDRIPIRSYLAHEQEAIYYSSWQYAAVHVLISIPMLQSSEALARALSLSKERVEKILEFLCQEGLAVFEAGRYQIGPQHLHLASDSPFIARHHTNWRTKVAMKLESDGEARETNLHYSSVVTVSRADLPRVREVLTRALAQSIDVIKQSPEEIGAVLNIDLMEL